MTNPVTDPAAEYCQIEAEIEPENLKLKQTINWLKLEINKFVTNRRITDISLKEFDAKIGIVLYLREKRGAILEDRKLEDDQQSNLAKIRDQLP